jgi:chromosome segregation ATPase
MLTEEQLDKLRSDNELLQLELDEVNMLIRIKEEELELLRQRAREAAAMQSRLDNNLYEFEQMQNNLGAAEQKTAGFYLRMQELEEDLCTSMKEQLDYAERQQDMNSLQANLLDTTSELEEASAVYKKLAAMKTKLAAAESNMEIFQLEIDSLKDELQEMKALNEMLRDKK